ncbi:MULTISPECIES: hypothetical protein [unclassified Streptomyces]|uniref:hypothetical protein n=1 Tax=unclassified Streptomyces TaxID=2593676 RepID=UPI0004BE4DEB|nr:MULTISPECIES: hypothetical protein [unclassified Streptomyces]KOV95953.1 hypothetical protein ADL04_19255 [Streptomyces sp. NRRL B-3648]
MRLRLPAEHPTEPPTGYKIAHPVLSQDGTRAGFTGVSLGGALPYAVLDDASCVYGLRHRPPARRCDCGFHCVHDRAAAEALLCTAEHRAAVLLEVSVLGAYIRFERGFRYARQRVRTVTAGPCGCGAGAVALADAGWGRPGWRALAPACAGCLRGRPSLPLAGFARLAGQGLRVVAGAGGTGAPPGPAAGLTSAAEPGVPELVAEAALLQARLDWFQSQLARLGDRGSGGAGQG